MSQAFSTVLEALRSDNPLRLRRILWITLVLASCARRSPPVETTTRPAASLSASAAAPAAVAPATWVENDYAGALARARSRNLPLFVDASAVWCHTCLAMRAFVLDEPALEKSALVWFSFDVERSENDAIAARYPAKVLPTFFVVDAASETVHGRWEGAATVDQMRDFLRDARRSIELSHAGSLRPDDPLALLLAGHRAAMANDHETARLRFTEALHAAPPAWSRRPDALLALIAALERGKEDDACLELALETLPGDALGRSSTLADFSASALACAVHAPSSSARARALRELVAKKLREVARDPTAPLSPDDRGDALRIVWDADEALGHHDGALAAARERLDVLDAAAKRAPNAAVASTFDGARLETLVFLGRAPDAVRFLTERERELPDDYNPPHRLASAYQALGEHENALHAIDRAIAKAWGARKARMLDKRADILVELGRIGEARKTLESELSHLASLPAAQKKPELEAAARKHLEKLAAP
ncbi:MAG TPA: thioredoxin family protein [Polyangiaceae bacterium]|nr:thioredoxin family protein [Polyangiaceae bacterium]